MGEKIKITVNYLKSSFNKEVEKGTTIEDILLSMDKDNKEMIVAAILDNELVTLTTEIEKECTFEFIDITNKDGSKIYQAGLSFIYVKAAKDILDKCIINIKHSLSKGLYTEIEGPKDITTEDVQAIKKRMQEIIDEDIKFEKIPLSVEEAGKIFEEQNLLSQARVLKYIDKEYINVYKCGWMTSYFYWTMVPSTRYISKFDLVKYAGGIILRFPRIEDKYTIPEFVENPKIAR
ncbi:MAG: nucleoside kinase, partial [Peptostreptococcales bacterium]